MKLLLIVLSTSMFLLIGTVTQADSQQVKAVAGASGDVSDARKKAAMLIQQRARNERKKVQLAQQRARSERRVRVEIPGRQALRTRLKRHN